MWLKPTYGSVSDPEHHVLLVPTAKDVGDDCTSPPRLNLKAATFHAPSPLSWWSPAFFSACARLTQLCSQRPLRLTDLWTLRNEDASVACAAQLKAALATSQSLVLAALRTQQRLLLASGALSLAAVACELTGPIAVYMVVRAAATDEIEHVLSKGAGWTLVLVASRFLRSVTLAYAELLLRVADVRVAGALQVVLMESVLDATYRHSHRHSGSANLFTIDIANVTSAFRMVHRLWMMPLELLGLFLVFRYVAGHVISGILLVSCVVYATIQLVTWFEAAPFRHWLAITDERFRLLERTFQHIVAIKVNVWEDWALRQILAVRHTEQRVLECHILLRTLRYTLTWIAPAVNLIATGVLLVNTSNSAFASPAFTFSAVAIFHSINDTFATAMAVVEVGFQFRVSLRRIDKTLAHSHIHCIRPKSNRSSAAPLTTSGRTHSLGATSDDAISVVGASFATPTPQRQEAVEARDAEALLVNVNLRVRRGEFVVVHGKVGCGKSVLLSALLGLLPKTRGGVYVNGRVAYCSQAPWIQSMSIRGNILFGLAFDAVRYWSVLDACCLLEDLAHLPAGDRTLVGSHGLVSMSSGQQARVALARACYADADIYVLDAPLDSVDSIVQCDVLLKCMGQLLEHKTIVLTTHNPEVIRCEYVDRAVLMEQMALVAPVRDTNSVPTARQPRRSSGGRTAAEHRPHVFRSKRSVLLGEAATHGGLTRRRNESTAHASPRLSRCGLRLNDAVLRHPLVMQIEIAGNALTAASPTSLVDHAPCAYRQKGWATVLQEYIAYSQSCSVLSAVVCLHLVTQVLSTTSVYCFSRWIASTGRADESDAARTHTLALFQRYMWVVAASCASFLCAALATFAFSLRAAGKLFECMTTALVHAPTRFFATNSVGRVLNRYARDLKAVDSSLQGVVFALLRSFFSSFCSLFASLAWLSGHILKANRMRWFDDDSNGYALVWWAVMVVNVVVTVGILSVFWHNGIQSNKPSGEMYLMYRETCSPLFNFVAEAMRGTHVVTAFGPDQTLRVAHAFGDRVDASNRLLLAMWQFETYVGLRCVVMESVLSSALLVVLIAFGHEPSGSAEPATIGLLLFLLLNLREDLKSACGNWSRFEKDLACVERVLEFIDVAPEAASSALAAPIDPFWPRTGAITFETVYFQYDSATTATHHYHNCDDNDNGGIGGAMALKNVSFHIDGGQKIGVVGRSGAGKSTLAMALLRVCDPVHGVVRIDGVDVTQVHVKALRSKISYVPPDPVFANATVREYLDPMGHVDDDATLWAVLRKTGVEASILRMQTSLDTTLLSLVAAWSAGERQLLCLSRALVLGSRIVILDEATTATDQETDGAVQDVVCDALDARTTLLCIAHRLDTVLEFDKILVMSDGGVEDFGTVQELVAAGDGVFYELLESAQLVY